MIAANVYPRVYSFPKAAMRNYHQLGSLKQQKCILSQFRKLEIRSQGIGNACFFWSLWGEICSMLLSQPLVADGILGIAWLVGSSLNLSLIFPWHSPSCVCVSVSKFPYSAKDICCPGYTPLWSSLNLITSMKVLFANKVTSTRFRWIWIWGETVSPSIHKLINFFSMGLNKKCFRLCRWCSCNDLTLPSSWGSSHMQTEMNAYDCVPIKLYWWTLDTAFCIIFTSHEIAFFWFFQSFKNCSEHSCFAGQTKTDGRPHSAHRPLFANCCSAVLQKYWTPHLIWKVISLFCIKKLWLLPSKHCLFSVSDVLIFTKFLLE